MKYRAAVIGCGRIGFGFDRDPKRKHVATHAGAYNFAKGVELEAVCDINKKALEECARRWHVRGAYTNFKKMLKKEKIDILSICTPPETHYSMLKEAVESPLKAIFCEKPLAVNVKDAEEMVRLCRKKGIILQVDHQRRFCPLHENIRDFIRKKKFRDVQQVNFYYTAGVRNTGSHMFDLLRFFFGDVEWIEAFLSKNISGKEAQLRLEKAGITINKNTIPYDPNPPFNPSGIRIGTPAVTTRGMKEKEMKQIALWINGVISNPKSILSVRREIKKLCRKFPLP